MGVIPFLVEFCPSMPRALRCWPCYTFLSLVRASILLIQCKIKSSRMTRSFVAKGGEANNGTKTATRENQNGYGIKKRMQRMVSMVLCLSRRKKTNVSAIPKMYMQIEIARKFCLRSSCTTASSISCDLVLGSGISGDLGQESTFPGNGEVCKGGEDGTNSWWYQHGGLKGMQTCQPCEVSSVDVP